MQRMLEIKQFVFGPFETNTYVVSDDAGHVLIVDPACYTPYEQQQLQAYVEDRLRLTDRCTDRPASPDRVQIVATHGHLDHLWGASWATEQWQTPVLLHEADILMAEAMQEQYELFGVRRTAEQFPIVPLTEYRPATPDRPACGLTDRITILHTPGHTPGSVCLYWPEEKVLLSGDTLFCMGYGRTDLPGGDIGALIQSLNRLFTLPGDVWVFAGHGESTTIGAEKR